MNIKEYHRNRIFNFLMLFCDIILIFTSSFFAKLIVGAAYPGFSVNIGSIAFFSGAVLLMFYLYELYKSVIHNRYEIAISVVLSIIVSMFFTFVLDFFVQRQIDTDEVWFKSIFAVTLFISVIIVKFTFLGLIKRIEGRTNLLVIESFAEDISLVKKIKYSTSGLYNSWYILIDVNNWDEIHKVVDEKYKDYDSIFISPSIEGDVRDFLISKAVALGMQIYLMPNLYNTGLIKSTIAQFDDTPVLKIHPFGLSNSQRFIKRAMDVIITIPLAVITLPVMLVCAIAIKLDSPGPVIYKQKRLTRYQRHFYVYKFRTMVADAEKQTGAVLATENDERITKVGKILRSLRLDELPQFFNILFGQMSLVGPRPERPEFVEQFLKEIPDYDKRFFVKAGLTGMAQVYGKYQTKVEDKVFFDILYIKGYSLAADIRLILLTIKVMFINESSKGVEENPHYDLTGKINRGI